MELLHHIEDTTLPIEVNFEMLKKRGLAFIQRHNKGTWTNLNPSDPGVTILDQLCFAFTELGYCNNFPIKDILTNINGNLEIKDQFYLPEDILTTSPITIEDYRKYLIDRVKNIKNVQIIPVKTSMEITNGIYNVFISIDSKITDEDVVENIDDATGEITYENKKALICKNAFFALNTCRNLGELFLYPVPLMSKKYAVYGNLELENDIDLNSILVKIDYEINNYVFPNVVQTGYDALKRDGTPTNSIFNGPKLRNGWIPRDSIYAKKNIVQAYELTEIIQSIPGIKSIANVSFDESGTLFEVNTLKDEILVFDFIKSLEYERKYEGVIEFQVNTKGRKLNKDLNISLISELSNFDQPLEQIDTVAAVKMTPDLPEGNYRDISSYYSIQNTFPDAYAVGSEGVISNATDFQIAQSRQLKAYLTLFDQVLANQFMQLANLGRLFSFRNSVTGTPTDRTEFYSLQTPFEKIHPEYPAPYISFSPTYYYQSLYKTVPHIRPLLRNFKAHQFGYEIQSPEREINDGWVDYKGDPYNTYIWGLMSFIEDDAVNIERRNAILDHLLARHGESPIVMDTIIEGTVFSGNAQKEKVIIKSLYLQNLGLLSYYRVKAYDFIGATPLKFIKVSKKGEKTFEAIFEATYDKLKKVWLQGNQKDFIFDTKKIDRELQITSSDFINYSAVELKLNLLFALNIYYQNYLINNKNVNAYWLIRERKGFLCIETNLLIESADFEIVITEDFDGGIFRKIDKKLSQNEFLILEDALKNELKFEEINALYPLTKEEEVYSLNDFKTIENTCYSWRVRVSWEDGTPISITDPMFENTLIFIFPDFIPLFKTPEFKYRLHYFLENDLPVQIQATRFYVSNTLLDALIPQYVNWHNNLLYDDKNKKLHGKGLVKSAKTLAESIKNLNHLKS
tara:strand:- start:98836 stop:101565 length:2730 start_codon:yes stop_codon:yes gene_type:complete